jgi:hypothetical protein
MIQLSRLGFRAHSWTEGSSGARFLQDHPVHRADEFLFEEAKRLLESPVARAGHRLAVRFNAYPFVESFEGGGFKHLTDAIQKNTERRTYYAGITGGKSAKLSNLLIRLEKTSLPMVMEMDHLAERFNEMGIPIMRADFISMSQVADEKTPPRFERGSTVASPRVLHQVREWISDYRKAAAEAAEHNDFGKVAELSYRLLMNIQDTETTNKCLFCMSKHLIESIGFFAMHAAGYEEPAPGGGLQHVKGYQELSKGETNLLSKSFVFSQLFAIGMSVGVDKRAQQIHQMVSPDGEQAGIIQNDVPHIPLQQLWEAGHPKQP